MLSVSVAPTNRRNGGTDNSVRSSSGRRVSFVSNASSHNLTSDVLTRLFIYDALMFELCVLLCEVATRCHRRRRSESTETIFPCRLFPVVSVSSMTPVAGFVLRTFDPDSNFSRRLIILLFILVTGRSVFFCNFSLEHPSWRTSTTPRLLTLLTGNGEGVN